jgi:OmpA-OmpF porin, OOP family
MNRIAAAVLAIAGLCATADAGVEVGGTAGVHVFSDTNALGTPMNSDVSQANSALFGLRLGVYFGDAIGVEVEGGVIPTEAKGGTAVFDIYNATVRGSLVFQLRAGNPENTLIPFFLAGGGAMRIVRTDRPETIREDTDGFGHVGLGLKYRAGNGWGVRFDARVLFPPDNTGKTVTQDFEALASLYREFGRKPVPKVAAVTTDDDPDKDGIAGAADQCPNEAEDKDGFQDEDGCPDPDNDGDGIPDESDKCPNEAEDKDGFQDEDGCPDPDNDGDGVPDAADKCPDQPETVNGFEDEDGCPDEIPEKLQAVLTSFSGVNFKANSADFAAGGTKPLDKIAPVLAEFTTVTVEIGVHTDDVPAKGKFSSNADLSAARAEAVKAYLVKKGADASRLTTKGYGEAEPVQDVAGLKGAKLNAARAANRRVVLRLVPTGETVATDPTPDPGAGGDGGQD